MGGAEEKQMYELREAQPGSETLLQVRDSRACGWKVDLQIWEESSWLERGLTETTDLVPSQDLHGHCM